jgi:uncharacterized membrane protein
MMAKTIPYGPVDRLPRNGEKGEILRHVNVWAKEGLITSEEAAAIREFERVRAEERPRRIAPIIQALLYMGTALTLAALATIYWRLYEDLPRVARVGTPALLAVALAAAGWFTARRTDPDVRRFGGCCGSSPREVSRGSCRS